MISRPIQHASIGSQVDFAPRRILESTLPAESKVHQVLGR